MATVNFVCENDADFRRSFLYQTASGAPVNLAGAEMDMKLRRQAEDATVFLWLSTQTGEIEVDNPAAGQFTITITQQQLLDLAPGAYEQSLVMTLGGLKTLLWTGTFTNNWGPSR
jgi:hypothetical protein